MNKKMKYYGNLSASDRPLYLHIRRQRLLKKLPVMYF